MAAEEEREKPRHVEKESNHRVGIVSDRDRRIDHLSASLGFGRWQAFSQKTR